MAEPTARALDPVPVRQAVVAREPLTLTPTWARWLEELRRQHLRMQAEIVDLQQRVQALESGP